MKISNSKKQLAQIIHENGGWRDGAEFAAQDKNHAGRLRKVVFYCGDKPWFDAGDDYWGGNNTHDEFIIADILIKNWHQTILSREEYFHIYPAPEPVSEAKPTIEQLAADYRNRKDYADRKQQEADAAKADAEVKLAELVAAGKALGLVLSVAGVEPELVITDWQDLLEGDVVWYGGDDGLSPGEYHVMEIEVADYDGCRTVLVDDGDGGYWIDTSVGWRFIRRPAKGGANA